MQINRSPSACSEGSALNTKSLRNPIRIFLVDDDQDLLEIMREMLEQIGFAVIPSQYGIDALKIVEDDPGFIDLLLTDIRMPKMAGPELAQQAKLLRPRMRVLFVSGDASTALASGELDSHALILPKPFSRRTLVQKVECAFAAISVRTDSELFTASASVRNSKIKKAPERVRMG